MKDDFDVEILGGLSIFICFKKYLSPVKKTSLIIVVKNAFWGILLSVFQRMNPFRRVRINP
jgi:hypothetical protein